MKKITSTEQRRQNYTALVYHRGESFTITLGQNAKPAAELVPVGTTAKVKKLAALLAEHAPSVLADLDDPIEEAEK